MSENSFDVVGIGNAIVDIISREEFEFLERFGLISGSMQLIDADRAVELYDAMAVVAETSGGSAGNTMTGVASLGGAASFIGKVAADHLGDVFAADSEAQGVHFATPRAADGDPTGRSMIVVTPDAERTMNTFLGAATTLYRTDIDADVVANAKLLFCEGYIWDTDVTKDAIMHAIDLSKSAGNRISFTLSDSFCVERHFDEWHTLLDDVIDVLFANETELMTLAKTDSVDDAIAAIRGRCDTLFATLGPAGSLVVTADEIIEVPAVEVPEVVDTNGAGDAYAAGVLYGLAHGYELRDAANLGSAAAAQVITHLGPRPASPLSRLLG